MLVPTFARPVTVLAGLGFPRRITDAQEALSWLEGEAAASRDEAYEATCAACRDAISARVGVEVEADEALGVFTAYARRRGILVEDDPSGLASPEIAARLSA
jgi:hypothetical protein